MSTLQKTSLFTELTTEESVAVSGGVGLDMSYQNPYQYQSFHFNLDKYLFILGAGTVFGNPGLTPDEVHEGWKAALGL